MPARVATRRATLAFIIDQSWRGGRWGLPYRAIDSSGTALSRQAARPSSFLPSLFSLPLCWELVNAMFFSLLSLLFLPLSLFL